MFKNETKNTMMAFAIALMFMVSACIVAIAPSDATDPAASGEYGSDSFTINMMVGEQFVYHPSANINDTTLNWTLPTTTPSGMTKVNGVQGGTQSELRFVPTATTTNSVATLTAAHAASGQSTGITQTITFNVYDPLSYTATNGLTLTTPSVAGTVSTGSMDVSSKTSANSAITTITAVGGLSPTFSAASQQYNATSNSNYGPLSNSPFTVTPNADTNTVQITTNASPSEGYYEITIPCTWTTSSSGNALQATQSQNVIVIIHVVDGVAIASGQEYIAVAGESAGSFDVSVNNTTYVTAIDASVANTSTTPTSNGVLSNVTTSINDTLSGTGPEKTLSLTINPSSLANADIDTSGKTDLTITVSATGTETVGGLATPFSISETATIHVYKSLRFKTTPTIDENDYSDPVVN